MMEDKEPKKGILKETKEGGSSKPTDPDMETKLRRAVRHGILNRVGPATQASTSQKASLLLDSKSDGLNQLAKKKVTLKLPSKTYLPKLYYQAKANFKRLMPHFVKEKHRRTVKELLALWKAGELSDNTQRNLVELSVCILENDDERAEELLSKIAREDLSMEMALFWKKINEMVDDQIDFTPDKFKTIDPDIFGKLHKLD